MIDDSLFHTELTLDVLLGICALLLSVMGIGMLLMSKGIKRYLGIILLLALIIAIILKDLTIVCTILAINAIWMLFSGFLVRAEQQSNNDEDIV